MTSGTERYAVDGWDTAKGGAVGTENFDVTLDLNGSNAVTGRRLFGAGFDEPVTVNASGLEVADHVGLTGIVRIEMDDEVGDVDPTGAEAGLPKRPAANHLHQRER